MSLVRMHNKKNDVTYLYESISFWDKEMRKTRSVRRLVGKVDPETGNVILTSRRGRQAGAADEEEMPLTITQGESEARARIVELEAIIHKQQEKIWHLERQNVRLTKTLNDILSMADKTRALTAEKDAAFAEQQANNAEREAAAMVESAAAAAKGIRIPSTVKGSLLGAESLFLGEDTDEILEDEDI